MKLHATNAMNPNHVFDGFHPRGRFPCTWGPKKAANPSPNEMGRTQYSASIRFQKKSVPSVMQMP